MSLDATPFHARAVEANRLNAWENRGTFTLASHYGSVEEEAIAARFGAVLADVSWHWRVDLSGEDSAALVSRLFTRDASALGMGATMEVLWLNDAGAVRGQGVVIRLDRTRFRVAAAAEDFDWIAGAARLYGVTVQERHDGALALIGPAAGKILRAAGFPSGLPPLSFRTASWRGLEVSLTRTGLGFVIGCQGDDAQIVWDRLMAAGRSFALLPAGQAALDIVETESGIVRPLRDYTPAREGFAADPTPQALGLSGLVDRAHLFNGRAGVLAAGPATALAGVVFEDEPARPGAPLIKGASPVGRLMSIRYSPAMKQHIGFAVLPDPAPEGPFTVGSARCRPVELPFLPVPAATETAVTAV